MSTFWNSVPLGDWLPSIVIAFGMLVSWRGLFGGKGGKRGLVRRGVTMLERVEGWRLLLIGLTFVGLGVAWQADARWLLFLTLGIGFVEIQEATHIIKAWQLGDVDKRSRSTREGRHRAPVASS